VRVAEVTASLEQRTFGVSVSDVTAIDSWVEDVTRRLGVSDQTAFRARVCIAELATNVLEHGICKAESDHIVISIDSVDDGIKIEFLDTRRPFDPTTETPVPPSGDPANGGGRGLLLLHAFAGKMNYADDGTYNRLKFEIALAD
jgi:anti-sigma regulatory factor (Ser/Thr protein kinase)